MDDRRDYRIVTQLVTGALGVATVNYEPPSGTDVRILSAIGYTDRAAGLVDGQFRFGDTGTEIRITDLIAAAVGAYVHLYAQAPVRECLVIHRNMQLQFVSAAIAAGERNYLIVVGEIRKGVQPYVA